MALKKTCQSCGRHIIPRRIKGYYIGSKDMIKIWECTKCNYLWR